MHNIISFACDYMEGAHPQILKELIETNLVKTPGYGLDPYCESAKGKIRAACNVPNADVFFLVGGTQTNAIIIRSMLQSYQGVIAADTGHVASHEAGAIELGGHKVLTLPNKDGKLCADAICLILKTYQMDANHDHMVMPGMVYISHPTEFGTLYTKDELTAISAVCREHHIPLFLDGARLAYALACPQNDITLMDLAQLCDVFYIGGTKCGALFGEAVVMPHPGTIPHFFTIIKQNGALLAKGRMLGIQFDVLFTDHLYETIGASAIQYADQIRDALAQGGYTLYIDTPTNQIFCVIANTDMERLAQQVEFSYMDRYDDTHSIIRFVTSWASTAEDVDALCEILRKP